MGFETLPENCRGAEYRLDKGVVDEAVEGEPADGSCSFEACEAVPESRCTLRRGVTGKGLGEIVFSIGAH